MSNLLHFVNDLKEKLGAFYYPALSACVSLPFVAGSFIQKQRMNNLKMRAATALGLNSAFKDIFSEYVEGNTNVRRIGVHTYRYAATTMGSEKKSPIYDLVVDLNVAPTNDLFYGLYKPVFPKQSTIDIEISFAHRYLNEDQVRGFTVLGCCRREVDAIQKAPMFENTLSNLLHAKPEPQSIANLKFYESVTGLASYLFKNVDLDDSSLLVASVIQGKVFVRYAVKDETNFKVSVIDAAEIARKLLEKAFMLNPTDVQSRALEASSRSVQKYLARTAAIAKEQELESTRKERIAALQEALKNPNNTAADKRRISTELDRETKRMSQKNARNFAQAFGMAGQMGASGPKKNLQKLMKF